MTRELVVKSLSTVKTRRQQWACNDLVPLGVPTILAGTGGIGKSTILAWLAAGLTRGTLAGDFHGQPVAVGFISGEDDPATTLVPRLQAAGADLDLVHDYSDVRTVDDDGNEWTGLPTIADDLSALKRALVDNGTRVLVIDPVMSLMSGDSIKASDVRRNLDPIAGLAAELGIAPILVMHFGKGQGNASDKVSGSHAFRDIARSVLLLAVDEESGQRILTVDKSNYSTRAPSLAFAIDSAPIATDDNETTIVGLARLLGETELTVHEIVRRGNDETLGDLSASIWEFVRSKPDGVTTAEVVEEFDIQRAQARVYLSRLVNSGRIERLARGQYGPKVAAQKDPVTPVMSVTTVTSNYPDVTHVTDITPHNGVTGTCPECGEPSSAVNESHGYLHPNCERQIDLRGMLA